jgi:hypothetical protein
MREIPVGSSFLAVLETCVNRLLIVDGGSRLRDLWNNRYQTAAASNRCLYRKTFPGVFPIAAAIRLKSFLEYVDRFVVPFANRLGDVILNQGQKKGPMSALCHLLTSRPI